MPRPARLLSALLCLSLATAAMADTAPADSKAQPDWTANLDASACKHISSRGSGAYFVLEPGFVQVLEGMEDGEKVQVVITVTNKTKKIGGIEARVVEEVETVGGKLKERTLDYLAVCQDSRSLLYLGEDVDNYENGKVKNHEGSWRHGSKGAKYGILMPGTPARGQRYYQEQAPGVGMDRAEVLATDAVQKTPGGDFKDCLKTLETNPLEPGHEETKVYARGIGVVSDGPLLLTKVERPKAKN